MSGNKRKRCRTLKGVIVLTRLKRVLDTRYRCIVSHAVCHRKGALGVLPLLPCNSVRCCTSAFNCIGVVHAEPFLFIVPVLSTSTHIISEANCPCQAVSFTINKTSHSLALPCVRCPAHVSAAHCVKRIQRRFAGCSIDSVSHVLTLLSFLPYLR